MTSEQAGGIGQADDAGQRPDGPAPAEQVDRSERADAPRTAPDSSAAPDRTDVAARADDVAPAGTTPDEAPSAGQADEVAPAGTTPDEAPSAGRADEVAPAAPRPPRSARVLFLTAILALEAFVMLFATLVAHGLRVAPLPWVWAVGMTALVVCVVGAGLVRKYPREVGVLGWFVQIGLAAVALVVPMVLSLAIVFALLWLIALRTGDDIDADRRVRYAAELEHHRLATAEGA
ncbi:DUF4233 domain-containing protein [Georgenia sp. Z1491]|uniref:DUF4233 domain-containing protein n=1 Tax=Georgenia sp. Z1491 TaxID=3416707 RepID=UPI003CEC1A45